MFCTRTALFVSLLLVVASVAQADITGIECHDDGDGVLTCGATYGGIGTTDGSLTVVGDHNRLDSGHLIGTVDTDTAEDPTLRINLAFENDTDYAWVGYIVSVTMNRNFTISLPAVNGPEDWTVASVTGPTQVDATHWTGSIAFAGPALEVGSELDIQYRATFVGATNYTICQELTPVPVPEPATLGLLALGGLLPLVRRVRRTA